MERKFCGPDARSGGAFGLRLRWRHMFTHTMLMWRDAFLPQCRTISVRPPAGESGRAVRPLIAGRIKNESVIEDLMAMRSILLRCLVVLVALALVGVTTVNARTHSMSSGAECLTSHDTSGAGTIVDNGAQHHKVHACLCCCLGCASLANRAPDSTSGVVPISALVSYGEPINALAGRILRPDPYPPRPSI
jgi:hypothetical protein